jgi:hypothetical protein
LSHDVISASSCGDNDVLAAVHVLEGLGDLARRPMLTLDGPSMRTKHLGLDELASYEASNQLAEFPEMRRQTFLEPTNSHRFMLRDDTWNAPGVRDVTTALRAVTAEPFV